jgi:hypothetical protein
VIVSRKFQQPRIELHVIAAAGQHRGFKLS